MARLTDAEKKARRVTTAMIDGFKSGDIAEPLALAVLPRETDRPIDRWSVPNRFGVLLMGCTDARTFNQWKQAGRFPKKGSSASAYITQACVYPADKEDPDGDQVLRGFKYTPVFDITVTEGDPVGTPEQLEHVQNLPLRDVAEAWGVNVLATDTVARGAAGTYYPERNAIALGVSNLSTWLHELMHQADDKLGNMEEKGQHWRSEIVAELGGAVLAHMIGIPEHADEGGCWSYVKRYAKAAKIDPERACARVVNRIGEAVALIIETAEELSN